MRNEYLPECVNEVTIFGDAAALQPAHNVCRCQPTPLSKKDAHASAFTSQEQSRTVKKSVKEIHLALESL